MKYLSTMLVIILAAMPGVSLAGERLVKFDVGFGFTLGGDELAYATFTDGDSEKIKAGELLHIYGGLSFDFPDSSFSTRVAIGYHFDDITAENGKIGFSRKPLEIVPFYNINSKNRIGVGLSYHLDPKLTSDILPDVTFDDALGFLVEYGLNISNGAWIGLRYVNIEYDPATVDGIPVSGKSIDGSHFGLYLQGSI